jgi:hypothetical protein
MDHKEYIAANENYINGFVVKHIGKPRKLGRAVFEHELKLIRKRQHEMRKEATEPSMAIRAMSRVAYCIGMYSVDNVNTMPRGTCVLVMYGAYLACTEMCQADFKLLVESVITESRRIGEERAREVFEELLQQEEDDGPDYDTGSGWVDP